MMFYQCSTSLVYGYLTLSITWPKGFCAARACNFKAPNIFTLHGLWPSTVNEHGPTNCGSTTAKFPKDIKEIEEKWSSGLVSNLKLITFPANTQYGLWSHEWKTHGRCMVGKSYTRHELDASHPEGYFSDSVYAFSNNVAGLSLKLSDLNVKPGFEYHADELSSALETVIGSPVTIKCATSKDNKQYLQEVLVYMDNKLKHYDLSGKVSLVRNCNKKNKIMY
ncbi:unnamed protein product [Lupinus luteus]|uniref:Uncharacterized protein n=1 Tax=Lupinus luteus TaxID=3873 RepID=A0AAV1XPH8_LUPLU